MAESTKISSQGAEVQTEIITKFAEVGAGIGSLVLRRVMSGPKLAHWLEPGAVVALESQLSARTIDQIYTEPDDDLPNSVIEAVSSVTGVDFDKIVGFSRSRDLIVPRYVAMYILRDRGKLSYPRIGHVFGRDHTTVLYAVNKIASLLATEKGGLGGETATLVRKTEARIAEVLKEIDYQKLSQGNPESGERLLDAVAVTKEGMYSYPTTKIKPLYAKALRIRDPDTLVLDQTNRAISDELLQTYGGITLSLLSSYK